MAKKQTGQDTGPVTPQVVVPSLKVDAGLNLDKEDIVIVAVAAHEKSLLVQKSRIDSEIKLFEKTLTKTQEEVAKFQEKTIQEYLDPEIQELKKALAKFEDLTFRTSSGVAEDVLNYTLTISSGRTSLSRSGHLAIPEQLRELLTQTQNSEQKLSELRIQAVNVRKGLASLDTVERQARAAVASQVLQQNDAGKEIIKALEKVNGPELQRLLGLDFLNPEH